MVPSSSPPSETNVFIDRGSYYHKNEKDCQTDNSSNNKGSILKATRTASSHEGGDKKWRVPSIYVRTDDDDDDDCGYVCGSTANFERDRALWSFLVGDK